MIFRLKIYLLWFALCGLLISAFSLQPSAFSETPPLPPGYAENPEAWLDEIVWPQFSTQSPKGNQMDPLATVPTSTKTVSLFSLVPETRRNLSLSAERIPLKPLHVQAYNPAEVTVLDVALGTPERKLVWVGDHFTNAPLADGTMFQAAATIYTENVIVLKWNQETNDVSEVEWSDNLQTWQSINHVRYTGQWTFTVADALTGARRFYRLQIQRP